MTRIAPTFKKSLFRAASAAALLGAWAWIGCGGSEPSAKPEPDLRAKYMPTPGVYEYATNGSETVDALLGATNSYPRQTRIRVVRRGCGYSERWTAGRKRWMQFTYCVFPNGSRSLESIRDFHEFFGYPLAFDYRCEGSRVPSFDDVEAGFDWIDRCSTRSTKLTLRGRVGRRATRRIAGQETEVISVQIRGSSSGRAVGSTTFNSLRVVPTGLIARRTVNGTASTRTSVGRVRSRERYRITLEDLKPLPAAGDSG